MKVLAKVLMMAMMLGAMHPILARGNNLLETLVALKELEHGKVQLTYLGKAPEKLSIHIYNEEDREIFKETIKSKRGVRKPYDISRLPYGEYRFEVRVANELVVHKVKHNAPEYPGNVKLLVAPIEESKIRIMVMGPEYKDFKLLIYDQYRNKILFEESIKQSGNVGRVFNLEETGAKAVRLVLSHKNNAVQSRTINL